MKNKADGVDTGNALNHQHSRQNFFRHINFFDRICLFLLLLLRSFFEFMNVIWITSFFFSVYFWCWTFSHLFYSLPLLIFSYVKFPNEIRQVHCSGNRLQLFVHDSLHFNIYTWCIMCGWNSYTLILTGRPSTQFNLKISKLW